MKGATFSKSLKAITATLALGLLATGCVAKGTYDKDVIKLAEQLSKEREQVQFEREALEAKLSTQSRSLAEITTQYIKLQSSYKDSQRVLNNLRSDMEILLRSIEELKLVVNTNMRGSEADEMIFTLNSMEKKVNEIIERASKEPYTR